MSEDAITLLRASGWTAILLLAGALAASPIARAFTAAGWRAAAARLPRIRRGLGIASASAGLVHAGVALALYLGDRPWAALAAVAWLRSGALALALLVSLLATSFPGFVRAARIRLWKPLHRLAYAAAALAVHHVLLSPWAPRAWALALAAAFGALLLLRLVPRKARAERREDPEGDASRGDRTVAES